MYICLYMYIYVSSPLSSSSPAPPPAAQGLTHRGWISDFVVYLSICISFAPLYMNISLCMHIHIFRPPHRLSTPRPLRHSDNELEFWICLYVYYFMYLSPPYVNIFINVHMYILCPPHRLPLEDYLPNTLPVAKEFRQKGWVSDIVVYIWIYILLPPYVCISIHVYMYISLIEFLFSKPQPLRNSHKTWVSNVWYIYINMYF